jgi:hypothetical protein
MIIVNITIYYYLQHTLLLCQGMSSLLSEYSYSVSNPIQIMLLARAREAKRTAFIREQKELSRSYTIAKGINKNILPLSSDKDGNIKHSPLCKVANGADIVQLLHNQRPPTLIPLGPMVFLIKIPPTPNHIDGYSKRQRFG